jgi:hypothetical protein
MPTNNALEIMQLALDGQATEEELESLRETLAASPEAQATYDALCNLVRRLEAVPLIDPPAIRASVLSRLRPARVTLFRPRRRTLLALAYAAAAVIVIGVAIHRAIPPSPSAATMVRMEEDFPVVAQLSSREATMTIRRNGDEFEVQAKVTGQGPVSLEWDGQKLSPATGSATFADRTEPIRLILNRRSGAAGSAVIRLRLPEKELLKTTVELR